MQIYHLALVSLLFTATTHLAAGSAAQCDTDAINLIVDNPDLAEADTVLASSFRK